MYTFLNHCNIMHDLHVFHVECQQMSAKNRYAQMSKNFFKEKIDKIQAFYDLPVLKSIFVQCRRISFHEANLYA